MTRLLPPAPLSLLSVQFTQEMCGIIQLLQIFLWHSRDSGSQNTMWINAKLLCKKIVSALQYIFAVSPLQAMHRVLLNLYSSHGHPPLFCVKRYSFSSKTWTKEKKAGALSLLCSQLSGRHTLLIYLFLWNTHTWYLIKAFFFYETYIHLSSTFFFSNQWGSRIEITEMSCHKTLLFSCI